MTRQELSIFAIALIAVGHAGSAAAQTTPGPGPEPAEATVPERESVALRARPDYDPLGIRVGSFTVSPAVDVSESYDSNVFAIPTATRSDFYTTVRPTFSIASDWNNNSVGFRTVGEIKRYDSLVSENVSNFGAFGDGRLDIERQIFLYGKANYQILHEDRTSPNAIASQKNPIEYQLGTLSAGYVHEPGRLGFEVFGNVNDYAYSNGQTATGATIAESFRNRMEYLVGPKVSYEIIPGYHAYVKATANLRKYDTKLDPTGIRRDSQGYSIDTGTAVELGRVINGEIFAGYFDQEYADATFKPVSGVHFGGNLLWNVTQLASIRGALGRSVEESIVVGTSSILQTTAGLSLEYEILSNVIATTGADYVIQEFEGSSRTDNISSANIGARYLLNRNLNLGLTGIYSNRDSNLPGNNYDRLVVMATIRIQD